LLKIGFHAVSTSTRTTHTNLDEEATDAASVCLHTILVFYRVC
jgi:hypothetical protein